MHKKFVITSTDGASLVCTSANPFAVSYFRMFDYFDNHLTYGQQQIIINAQRAMCELAADFEYAGSTNDAR